MFAGAARKSRLRTRDRDEHPKPRDKLLTLLGYGGMAKLVEWNQRLRRFAHDCGLDPDEFPEPSAFAKVGGQDSIAARPERARPCVLCVGEGERERERERDEEREREREREMERERERGRCCMRIRLGRRTPWQVLSCDCQTASDRL